MIVATGRLLIPSEFIILYKTRLFEYTVAYSAEPYTEYRATKRTNQYVHKGGINTAQASRIPTWTAPNCADSTKTALMAENIKD